MTKHAINTGCHFWLYDISVALVYALISFHDTFVISDLGIKTNSLYVT